MTRKPALSADKVRALLGARRADVDGGHILVSCGDGLPDSGEACDDGNTTNGDGCSSTCEVEVPFACSEQSGNSPLNDEGLELGGRNFNPTQPNPFWAETATQGFFPICSAARCQPLLAGIEFEGVEFGWFGGTDAPNPSPQVQTLTQNHVIAAARTSLTFFTLRGICHSGNADALVVSIDGNNVYSVPCNATDDDWVLQSVNLATAPGGPYNDGAAHQIRFTGTTRGSGAGSGDFTNIFLDFINLGTGAYPAGVTPIPSMCTNACGNGSPDGSEQCDDGNTNNGDGCSSSCTVEPGFTCTDAVAAQPVSAVNDASFELGSPNPFWTEASTSTLLPISSVPTANTGSFVAWYGGIPNTMGAVNTASVSQTVTIPPAATELTYFVARQVCDPSGLDTLDVLIDGVVRQTLGCPFGIQFEPYIEYSIDLAALGLNNGGSHTLQVRGTTRGSDPGQTGLWTNFFVDDVNAYTGAFTDPIPSVCTSLCYSEDFDGPSGGDLSGWTVFNTGETGVDWGTTDDGDIGPPPTGCWSNTLGPPPADNVTGGSGQAACVDSDAAGSGLTDAYLCSPQLGYGGFTDPELIFKYNYQIFQGATAEDLFEVLAGTAAPGPGTIGSYTSVFSTTSNAGGLASLPGASENVPLTPQNGYLCFHYRADFDWYAELDDVGIQAASCTADSDGDGITDDQDNCINTPNADQRDVDGDGIGSACDSDLDQNCAVNFADLGIFKLAFFGSDPNSDFDGNGSVNFADLGVIKTQFFENFMTENPSGVPNLCSP